MNLIFAFIAIVVGALEGTWKAIEKSIEDFGGIATACAVIALFMIVFNILDKNDPSWEIAAVPLGLYLLARAARAISDRINHV